MRRIYVLFAFCLVALNGTSQEYVYSKNYYEVKEGKYVTQSTKDMDKWIYLPVVTPQQKSDLQLGTGYFKKKESSILLFDTPCFTGGCTPIKILGESSFLTIETTFYQEIYLEKGKEYPYTFNVWHAVSINGKLYYTDYKVHDFIAYEKPMEIYDQKLVLIAQSGGYDEFYDNGYPEKFFTAVLNDSNEVIYVSSIFSYVYGDEFFEPDFVVECNFECEYYKFLLHGLEQNLKFNWDGKVLTIEK